MNELIIREIESKIGHKFENKSLLVQAFIRRSYANEYGGTDNEFLEFKGDRALDYAVILLLEDEHCRMRMDPDYRQVMGWNTISARPEPNMLHSRKTEGELTEIKKALVQRKNLARRIDELGLMQYIFMSQSDFDNHVEEQDSVKEDLFEAIIGAVATDCNSDFDEIKKVVDCMLQPDLYEMDKNYICELQEWTNKKYGVLPHYEVKLDDTNHIENLNDYICDFRTVSGKEIFAAYLTVVGIEKTVRGIGNSRSSARQDAARIAIEHLEQQGLLFCMKDEIPNPSREQAINQLEILARRGYFVIPEYSFEETYDDDGNPIWHCVVCIPETKAEFYADSSSKKDAKKDAAYKLLIHLLED